MIRIAIEFCAVASARPIAAPVTFICLPRLRTMTFSGDGPAGATELRYLKDGFEPVTTCHPGLPTPTGASSTGCDGSLCENSSTVNPPGVPIEGSSAPPSAGNGKAGSFDWKTSFSLPFDDRLSCSFLPEMGWSSAVALSGERTTASSTQLRMRGRHRRVGIIGFSPSVARSPAGPAPAASEDRPEHSHASGLP